VAVLDPAVERVIQVLAGLASAVEREAPKVPVE
jgi:hypothetical protein